jgi:hypothetical protein
MGTTAPSLSSDGYRIGTLLTGWNDGCAAGALTRSGVLKDGQPAPSVVNVAAFRGRLWLFGGADHGDVWSSADGRDWTREPDLPGIPRAANYSVVFRDALWVFGGKTGGRGGTGFSDEVWALR